MQPVVHALCWSRRARYACIQFHGAGAQTRGSLRVHCLQELTVELLHTLTKVPRVHLGLFHPLATLHAQGSVAVPVFDDHILLRPNLARQPPLEIGHPWPRMFGCSQASASSSWACFPTLFVMCAISLSSQHTSKRHCCFWRLAPVASHPEPLKVGATQVWHSFEHLHHIANPCRQRHNAAAWLLDAPAL